MSLVSLTNISVAYGDRALLDNTGLVIDKGEKLGLIGRNGEGKSTLLKLIHSQVNPDSGEIRLLSAAKTAYLEQTVEYTQSESVYDVVSTGLGEIGAWLAEYEHLSNFSGSGKNSERIVQLQQMLDAADGWNIESRVKKTLAKLGLNGAEDVCRLSGGWQRRVSLARALVNEPDLLLLDEPTNHLDIDSINWLETTIEKFPGAVFFVTHDREFLDAVCSGIVELDRGKLTRWPGNFSRYQEMKSAALETEIRRNAEFDKKLAEEEIWIRKGIQARRTRNEGRVRALIKMRRERQQRVEQQSRAGFAIEGASPSSKRVVEAHSLHFRYDERILIEDFSIRILRGDRIGFIGPNGSGKTTLIKILLGELAPQMGEIQHGVNVEVAYFDQLRGYLDPDKTVVDTIGQGRDQITINKKSKHIISYLSDFLFSPARARSPIRSLSGGERARVLLALLFSRPANLIVMDEPTNDLDIETLELLEERLSEFEGTLFLVSHDRKFLDNVVTSTLVFEGNGKVREHVGGYSDWLEYRAKTTKPGSKDVKKKKEAVSKSALATKPKTRKLGYREQQELAALPELIENLESEQQTLTNTISDPGFYQRDGKEVAEVLEKLKSVTAELDKYYERWADLEG